MVFDNFDLDKVKLPKRLKDYYNLKQAKKFIENAVCSSCCLVAAYLIFSIPFFVLFRPHLISLETILFSVVLVGLFVTYVKPPISLYFQVSNGMENFGAGLIKRKKRKFMKEIQDYIALYCCEQESNIKYTCTNTQSISKFECKLSLTADFGITEETFTLTHKTADIVPFNLPQNIFYQGFSYFFHQWNKKRTM